MKYMLFLYGDENQFHSLPPAEQEKVIGEHMAYSQALTDAGAMVGGNPLDHPKSGMAVRKRAGTMQVEDGPFADAKEHLGGYYIIDVTNLDEALDWASRCPAASDGVVEVRPAWNLS